MPDSSSLAQIDTLLQSDGTAGTLQFLADELRKQERHYELFEALKMQVRHRLGLPLSHDENAGEVPEDVQRALEDGLFDACREVGTLMMKSGKPAQGWSFLRPVGDAKLSRELLEAIPVTDENVDEIVEVAIREGVSPGYGFGIVLNHHGTCNSITTMDAEIARCELPERRKATGVLVEHLHAELLANIRADIERREGASPREGQTLLQLTADRPELFENNAYHIDTTHLSSVIRFARILEDRQHLELALDLTEYANRLAEQYHYEGDEPFGDAYPSAKLYLGALLNRDVDEACAYFAEKAATQDADYYGPIAIETYIDLLTRVGRLDEAISKSIELLPNGPQIGMAKHQLELCRMAGDFSRLKASCRQKADLLGYAMSVLHESEAEC